MGPVTGKALAEAGYETFADLAEADPRRLGAVVGAERAGILIQRARGVDDRPVEPRREAKSYGEENTFEEDVRARERVTETLTSHAHAIARRLRRDGYEGRTITIKAKLSRARGRRVARGRNEGDEPRYPLLTRSRTLARATDDGRVLRKVAIDLWDKAAIGEPVRLLGVAVSNLARKDDTQLDLFADAPDKRDEQLGPALDAIRERFGDGAIRVGADAPEKLTPSLQKKRGE